MTTVRLTPPQISKKTVLEKIACNRPMREGKFQISVEQVGKKTVVHCYGHGGAGWTTLFGSVHQAVDLFQKTDPSKHTPIRVIGSGCVGLTTAIELKRLGYNVKGISTKELYDIASWKAAGCFALLSLKTSLKEQENMLQIGLNTFHAYQQIQQGNHPYLSKEIVQSLPIFCSIDTDPGILDLETREHVTLDFGNGVIHPNYVKYTTYFMNATSLMQQFTSEVKKLGIPITLETVESFEDLSEEIVFNCSGMGASKLCQDTQMIPVRGHLITLKESAGTAHMDYMIYTKLKTGDYVYLFPKTVSVTTENPKGLPCAGVLGGTFIPENGKIDDEKEFEKTLNRNSQFFQGHDV